MSQWKGWTEYIPTGERQEERELPNSLVLLEIEACLNYKWWFIYVKSGYIVLQSTHDNKHRWCYEPLDVK